MKKNINDYPPELRSWVKDLRTLQGGIDRRERESAELRKQRDEIIDHLITLGMGPKEALAIVGLGRNAYYQRLRRLSGQSS